MSLGSLEEFPCSETVSISFNIHDTTVVSHEDIWIEDSLLIVKSQNRNGFLRFYSLNTGEFIKSYGVIGRGPGEVLVDREGNSFIFFSWEGKPLARVVLPDRALSFDIDVDERQLYVVGYEDESILRYTLDLSGIIES